MVGDIEYYRKRFGEALDEYGLLNAYEYEEGTPEFAAVERTYNCFVDRMLAEVGF